MRPRWPAAVLVFLASIAAAQGPSAADIEARLPSLAGRERARALSQLTELLQMDEPKKALAYGALALEAFGRDPDPAPHMLTLANMAWAHMTLGQYDEAEARGQEAVRMAEKFGDHPARADALNNLGSIAQRRGDPVRAVDLFTQALEVARRASSDDEASMALNNLGFVYVIDLADYARGLQHHLEALTIRERRGNEADVALSLNNIGLVYYRLRQYDQALEYLGRALTLRRKLGPAGRTASVLHNLADAHLDRRGPGDLAAALAGHREALEIRRRADDRWSMSLSHRALGSVYLAMGKLAEAERELERARELGDTLSDKGHAVANRLGLSAVYRQSGRSEEAVAVARQALETASGLSGRDLLRRSLEELAAAQEAAGHPAAALATYRKFKAVSDEILDEGMARRIASVEKRYEIEKREHELERLVSVSARQRDIVAGGTVLLGFGAFALYRRRVEKARLAERLSVTDTLTELRNRRYVHQTMGADMARSVRLHREAAEAGAAPKDADIVFFLVDVDGFKAVNDAHGHAAGDLVLSRAARRLESACRQSDVVVRWGGEEFLVVARFTERAQAPAQAERLRRTIEEERFALDDGRVLAITCSVGFAAFPFARREPEAIGWEKVVAIADHAAYAAKRAGRNSWVGLRAADDQSPGEEPPTTETLDAWIAAGRVFTQGRSSPPA